MPRAPSLSLSPPPSDAEPSSSMPRLPRSTPANPSSTTSTVLNHTIPPFYACYLLRSFNKARGGTYIGSTPDPPRRFKQHSGEITGGAWKTQRGRPWEMEVNVYGFPSKLQALQFEWAWQNPHASRHLHSPVAPPPPGEKPAAPVAQFPKSALSNKPLTKVQVLQFMLTVAPWRSFGLKVRLYSKDAKGWWDEARRLGPVARTDAGVTKWKTARVKAGKIGEDPWEERGKVLDATEVEMRVEGVDGRRLVREGMRTEEEAVERVRIDDHDFFDPHWEKWSSLPEAEAAPSCEICAKPVDVEDHLSFFLCTAPTSTSALAPCSAVYHLPCLSSSFLSSPSTSTSTSVSLSTHLTSLPSAAPPSTSAPPLLPTHGACPGCAQPLHWVDLVRGSYRRKEEAEGKRKKRTYQKGSKEGAARKRTRKAGSAAPTSSQPVKKGKGKACTVDVAEESDEERFDFSDVRSDDLDSDEERQMEEMEEQERSWAYEAAAEGALADVGVGMDEDGDLWDDLLPPVPSAPAPPPPPASPKKRGRPPKDSAAKAAPEKVSKRAAPAAKKATLSSAFTSTKSSLSTTVSTASKPAKPRAVHPPSESDDDLLPPSLIGVAKGRAKKAKDPPLPPAPAKKAPVKRKVAYVELSD
ncbi:hypothetical protein JCM10213_000128 [Rhodosporidiobolus nylandii]